MLARFVHRLRKELRKMQDGRKELRGMSDGRKEWFAWGSATEREGREKKDNLLFKLAICCSSCDDGQIHGSPTLSRKHIPHNEFLSLVASCLLSKRLCLRQKVTLCFILFGTVIVINTEYFLLLKYFESWYCLSLFLAYIC